MAGELRRRGVMRLLIGVSGGADSNALLLASVASGVEVTAVHCNYHLRGEESNRDAAAVAGFESRNFSGNGVPRHALCRVSQAYG